MMHSAFDPILLAGLIMVFGLYLQVSGWRGRRVGTEPRCRTCGYILLYLQSARCPECGTAISAKNTVVGERQRRWGQIVAGGVLIILGCLPMIVAAKNAYDAINWYHYKPVSVVLADLDSPGTFDIALSELWRRHYAEKLSGSARHKLIDKALREQARTVPPSPPSLLDERQFKNLMEYLSLAFAEERMTPSQKKLFLDQAIVLTIATRPIVAEGDKVPIHVWYDCRAKSYGANGLGCEYEHMPCKIDGQIMRHPDEPERAGGGKTGPYLHQVDSQVTPHYYPSRRRKGNTGTLPWGVARKIGTNLPAGSVGKHVIETKIVWTFWSGKKELATHTYTAKTTYEVVPRNQAPKIELLDMPELHEQVRAAIQLQSVSWTKNRRDDLGTLYVWLKLAKPPCDVAFDVFFKVDGKEIKVGSVSCAQDEECDGFTGEIWRFPAKARVAVILRSSEEVARSTVDRATIYSGEIEFKDVPVKWYQRDAEGKLIPLQ